MKFFKTTLRIVGYLVLGLLIFVVLFLVVSVAPVDRSVGYTEHYLPHMISRIDSTQQSSATEPYTDLSVGFAKVNITPASPVAIAGNRRGKPYTSVHDSIFVRAMVVDDGARRVAIVSADLLVIPPTVTALLEEQLPGIQFTIENTYLGATHTHHSIGNWGEGATGIIYGSYKDSIVHFIANKIVSCVDIASQNLLPAKVKAAQIPVRSLLRNRLVKGGSVDSLLRIVEVNRSDSSKLLLMSYTAHATCLFSKDLSLSRDFPGELVDDMEMEGYTFAMYMAGAVGSHGCSTPEGGQACVDWMADTLRAQIIQNKSSFQPIEKSSIEMYRIGLALPDAQVKILKDWRLRSWLFELAFGEYPNYLTAFKFGNVVMLGTPCDYSGQLTSSIDSIAKQHNLWPMVTSFNGSYIGYLTPSVYYDVDHYETRLMNWYGVGSGEYVQECLEEMLLSISEP